MIFSTKLSILSVLINFAHDFHSNGMLFCIITMIIVAAKILSAIARSLPL